MPTEREPSSTATVFYGCYSPPASEERPAVELRQYWSIIRRRWLLPVALTLVALLAATVVGVRGASAFKTDMRVAISTIPTPDPNATLYYDPGYYANLDSEYLADDMSEFMTSRAFANEVSRELSTAKQFDLDINLIVNATRTKKTHRFIDVTITTATFEEGDQISNSISRILNDKARLAQYLQAVGRRCVALDSLQATLPHAPGHPLLKPG